MNSKNLHKHALPIVSLAVAGVLAIVGLALYSQRGQLDNQDVASTLTARTLNVEHTSGTTIQFHLGAAGSATGLPTPHGLAYKVALTEALSQ